MTEFEKNDLKIKELESELKALREERKLIIKEAKERNVSDTISVYFKTKMLYSFFGNQTAWNGKDMVEFYKDYRGFCHLTNESFDRVIRACIFDGKDGCPIQRRHLSGEQLEIYYQALKEVGEVLLKYSNKYDEVKQCSN